MSARSAVSALTMLALVVLGAWSLVSLEIDLPTIVYSAENAVAFTSRMFPLDFPPVGELLEMIVETLAIVVLATTLAVVLSFPVALAAATPTTSGPALRAGARFLIVFARAVPDLVLAIVFLRLVGLGPLAGIAAMGIHSVGMVGKLYADAIEELDDSPRQAIEAAGGTRWQQIWAAIPQALMPQIIATALHRFDINLRTSVLLGYVGVGGIGLEIADALRSLDFQRGVALALVVLALCIVLELASGLLRSRLMRRESRAARGTWGRWRPWLGTGAIMGLVAGSFLVVDLDPRALWKGVVSIPATVGLFFPPSFGGIPEVLLTELLVTVQIALAATILGVVLALPIGVLAAHNVVAHRFVHSLSRVVIVVVRGIPELILAIVFVVISGLGAAAGTLALAIGAVGLLSKLVADSLEETDTRVQEAVRAGGASRLQVFWTATVRQAAPAFVAHVLYLLDTNIRSATLLGVVGAGGIGFFLLNAARVNQFDVVTMTVLLIGAVVLMVEGLAIWLRRSIR